MTGDRESVSGNEEAFSEDQEAVSDDKEAVSDDKALLGNSFMDDLTLLENRLKDLARLCEKRMDYTFSGFLSLNEQDLFVRLLPSFPVKASLYAPSETSERKLACFGDEESLGYPPVYPVSVLKIEPVSEKFSEPLSHRDYLGAVVNTGIDRSLTGDIVIREKTAWMFCLDSIADFLCHNLTRVRHNEVKVSVCTGDVPELAPLFEELRLNVSSERLDSVAAAFTNMSRSKASALFERELVYVNSRVVKDPSDKLKEGDVLNIRGFGKAIYEGIGGTSKKGRLYVVLKKYV